MNEQMSLSEQLEYNTEQYVQKKKGHSNNAKVIRVCVADIPSFANTDIINFRESHQLTQAELSLVLGVSSRTVESWEQGRSKPNGSARRLMAILNDHPSMVNDIIDVDNHEPANVN